MKKAVRPIVLSFFVISFFSSLFLFWLGRESSVEQDSKNFGFLRKEVRLLQLSMDAELKATEQRLALIASLMESQKQIEARSLLGSFLVLAALNEKGQKRWQVKQTDIDDSRDELAAVLAQKIHLRNIPGKALITAFPMPDGSSRSVLMLNFFQGENKAKNKLIAVSSVPLFQNILDRSRAINTAGSDRVFLLNQAGITLAHPIYEYIGSTLSLKGFTDQVIGQNLSLGEFEQEVQGSGGGVGKHRYYFEKLSDLDLYLVSRLTTQKEVLGPPFIWLKENKNLTLGVVFVVFLLSLFTVAFSVWKPLQEINGMAPEALNLATGLRQDMETPNFVPANSNEDISEQKEAPVVAASAELDDKIKANYQNVKPAAELNLSALPSLERAQFSFKEEGFILSLRKVIQSFKAPILSILGHTQVLSPLVGADNRNLMGIESEARRVREYIEKLSAFVGLSQEPSEVVMVEELVKQSLVGVEALSLRMGVKPEVFIENKNLKIEAAVGELKLALIEILRNALESMERGLDKKLSVSVYDRGGLFDLIIGDTGMGLSPEEIKGLFWPFALNPKDSSHTGLGFVSSFGIIKKHLGEVQVQSELGKGTQVKITFPSTQKDVKKDLPEIAKKRSPPVLTKQEDVQDTLQPEASLETAKPNMKDANIGTKEKQRSGEMDQELKLEFIDEELNQSLLKAQQMIETGMGLKEDSGSQVARNEEIESFALSKGFPNDKILSTTEANQHIGSDRLMRLKKKEDLEDITIFTRS